MSNQDLFKLQQEKREKQKKELEAKKNKVNGSNFTPEQIQFCEIERDKQKAFRFTGLPHLVRQLPTDAKIIAHSRILHDNKKGYFHCVWKTDADGNRDEEWFLFRFFTSVFARKWHKYTEEELAKDKDKKANKSGGEWIYLYKDSPVYKRIYDNTKPEDKYPPSFAPAGKNDFGHFNDLKKDNKGNAGKQILLNVIDKNDDWCKINKHTKVLTKRIDTFENKSTHEMISLVHEPGIPLMLMDRIFDDSVKHSKTQMWEDYDIVLEKKEKDYVVRSAFSAEIDENMKKIATEIPLTEEERNYAKYNLDKLFNTTSYSKIKKNIIGLIKAWDAESGTKFVEELEELVKKEEAERAVTNETEEKDDVIEDTASTPPVKEEVKETPVEKKEEPAQPKPRERKPSSANTPSMQELFPFYDKLSAEDKKLIDDNFDGIENGEVKWKCDFGLCTDPSCKNPFTGKDSRSPYQIKQCPICGTKF
jgi:hypothetical protein